jgi:TonB-linked outer membrane protein, SusC/RagA family
MKNCQSRKLLPAKRMLVFLFIIMPALVFSQTKTITGLVVDDTGESVIGASVVIKGTNTGTITNLDGKFSINATPNDVLVISYIGFNEVSIPVGNQTNIRVEMKEDLQQLEEVVVVGYGVQKKSDITGAMIRVGEKEMKAMPVQNALQAMQGKTAGVDITSNERPGEIGEIRIRGERSLNASNGPLYVVDGIPLQGVGIENLNPGDIESVDILKDASATAIYGSRGANGVILVTTKRGKSGKTMVNYAGTLSIEKLYDREEMMNASEWLEYSRYAKTWGNDLTISKEQDAEWFGKDPYAWANIEKGWAGGTWDGSKVPTYDWTKEGKQTAYTHEHTISISGGSDKLQAYTSFGYLKQEGTQPGQSYDRYTAKASIDAQPVNWFKMGTSMNVTYGDQEYGYNFRRSKTGANNLYSALKGMLPYAVPYTPEGEYIRNPGGDVNIINPIRESDLSRNERQNIRAFGSFYAELDFGNMFEPVKGLKYRFQFGPDIRYGRTGIAAASTSINGDGQSRAEYDTEIKKSWTLDNLIYYDKMIGKHSLGLTLLQSASAYKKEGSDMSSFVESDRELWYNMGSAKSIQGYGTNLTRTQLASYMARVNYGFADKYLLTASGRWDGASMLADGHKWDFFPSLALGWRLEQEDFMKNLTWMDQLKLRFGVGITGNSAIDAYATLGAVSPNYYHFGNSIVPGMIASDPSAAEPVVMSNKGLGWEKTTQYNVGIDFSVFNGRFSGTIDLYTSKTKDLLMKKGLPSLIGYTTTWANVGSTENKGIDITLNSVNIKNRNFGWNSSLTFSADRNEIVELADGRLEDLTQTVPWIVGEAMGIYYDYVYDGIWKTSEKEEAAKYGRLPGQIKIKDISGPDGVPDGVIDANYDRKVVGTRRPDWSGGLLNTLTYKNFELSFFLYARFGFTVETGAQTLSGRFAMRKLDYWIAGINENAEYYAPGVGGESGDTYNSSMNYQDGSFIKLRNISLGYNVPPQALRSSGISNLKLYVQCMNPGLIYSKIDYLDPDLGGSTYNRSLVLGLNVSF